MEATADFDGIGVAASNIRYRAVITSSAPPEAIARLLQETDGGGVEETTYTAATDDVWGDLHSEYGSAAGSGGPTELYHQYCALDSTDVMSDDEADLFGPYRYRAFGAAANTAGGSTLSLPTIEAVPAA